MAHYTLLAEGSEGSSKQYDDYDSSTPDNDFFLEKNKTLQPQKPFYSRHIRPIALHSVLFTINLVMGFVIWYWARNRCPFGVYGPGLVYSKFIHLREAVAKKNFLHSTSSRRYSIRSKNLGFHQCLLQERFSEPEQAAQGTGTPFS